MESRAFAAFAELHFAQIQGVPQIAVRNLRILLML